MGVDADILKLLNSNIRLCLGNMIAQGVCLVVLTALRQRKRSLLPLAVYMWGKSMLMMTLMDLRIWYGNTETLLLISAVVGVCTTVASVWLTMRTYEGDFVTMMLSGMGAEVIGEAVLQISVLTTNLLEGRPDLLAFRAEFQWADLQILLWGALAFAAVYYLLIPQLRRFRKYEIRQKKIVNTMKIVCAVYILLSPLPGMTDFQSGTLYLVAKYVITMTAIAFLMVSVYLVVTRYQRDLDRQREFLFLQKGRMERYYQGMQRQIREMEQNQQSMDLQMEKITGWKKEQIQDIGRRRKCVAVKSPVEVSFDAKDNLGRKTPEKQEPEKQERQNRAALYLRELRQEYEKFRGGMYCNDQLTDAVLYCQKEAAESMGISVEYAMSCYSRGRIGEEAISQILFYLLDFGIREAGKKAETDAGRIILHAGVVKNQLVFDFSVTCRADTKNIKMVLRELLEKWNGTMTEILQEQGTQIVISLER